MVKPPSTPPSSDLEGVNMDVRIGNGADSIWVVKPDRRAAGLNLTECRRDYLWATKMEQFNRFSDEERCRLAGSNSMTTPLLLRNCARVFRHPTISAMFFVGFRTLFTLEEVIV